MIRRTFRIAVKLGLLVAVGALVFKALRREPEPATVGPTRSWPPLEPDKATFPTPRAVPSADPVAPAGDVVDAAKRAAATAPVARPAKTASTTKRAAKKAAKRRKPLKALWVEPEGDVCPTSHPVKAKMSSKIFHLPGMLNYERTSPDRCYLDADAAEKDGLRPAKR